jgi:hemolysin activation/secretion protein
LGVLYAKDPGSSTFGRLRYKTKLFSPRIELSFGAATNDFVLGPSESEAIDVLELEGGTRQRDVELQYALERSRTDSSYVSWRGEQVESLVRIGSLPEIGNFGFDDKVRNSSVAYRFDSLKESARTLHQGELRLTSGKFLYGQEVGQDTKYRIVNGDYTAMSFWKVPWLEWETRFILSSFLQYASGPLSSINRAMLGGPSRVKAYSLNAFSADDAIYAGGSLVFNGPKFLLDGHVQPLVFADAAHGRVRSLIEGEDDQKATLVDAGVGLQLASYAGLRGNLLVAFPMRASLSAGTEEEEEKLDRGPQVVMDIQYVW